MADEIIVKYVADVKQLQKSLDGISKRLDKVEDSAEKSAKSATESFNKASTNITASLKNIAGAVGLAFGTQQLVAFGKEAVQLAAKAEGVRRAFEKLNNPNLLRDLRTATRGTVSDLVLMQQAVRAQNFKVPLEKLAGFFKFATNRSIETGESVDYLVNSIIDGIGRKSTLVLDNLGISATELQAEIKKTGDFGEAAGNIIARSLSEAGDVADSTAIKMEQLNAKLDNAKVVIGDQLIISIDKLASSWDLTADSELKALDGAEDYFDSATDGIIPIIGPLQKVGQLWQLVADNARIAVDGIKEVGDEALKAAHRLTLNNEELIKYNKLGDEAQLILAKRTLGLQEHGDITEDATRATEQFNKQLSGGDEVQGAIKNLFYYDELIKQLKKDQKDANATRAEVAELEVKINQAIEDRLHLLGRLTPEEEKAAKALEEALKIDEDESYELLGDGLDDFVEETERATSIADDLWNAHFNELMALQDEAFENEKRIAAEREMITQETLSSISSLVGSIAQIQQNAFREEQNLLEQRLEQGLITREQFDEKTKEIRQKQAAADKDAALFQAAIATSQAIMQALGSTAPPASYALAAVAGALGAAQIAAIASQPLPQFAEGVIDLQGAGTATSDSIHAKLSKGESVMTAKETQLHKDLFQSIRSNKYDEFITENHVAPIVSSILDGGFGAIGDSMKLNNIFNDKNLLRQGDRNRMSQRQGWIYLGKKIDQLNRGNNRWN